jgi:tetratricopeptide (TPR) repeat protein
MATKEELEAKFELADKYYGEEKYRSAFKECAEVLRQKDATEYPEILIKALALCSLILRDRGKATRARRLLEYGRTVSYDSTSKVLLLLDLVVWHMKRDNSKEAMKVLKEIEELYNRRPDLKDDNYARYLETACIQYLEQIQKGEIYHEEFRHVYNRLKIEFADQVYLLRVEVKKATLIERDYERAIRLLKELIIRRSDEDEDLDKFQKSLYYKNLASLYWSEKHDTKQANYYFQESLKKDPDLIKKAETVEWLVCLNYSQNDYSGAIERYKSLKKEMRNWSNMNKLWYLRIVAESYRALGKREKYKKLMWKIFKKRPWWPLAWPFVPDKIWLWKPTLAHIFSE